MERVDVEAKDFKYLLAAFLEGQMEDHAPGVWVDIEGKIDIVPAGESWMSVRLDFGDTPFLFEIDTSKEDIQMFEERKDELAEVVQARALLRDGWRADDSAAKPEYCTHSIFDPKGGASCVIPPGVFDEMVKIQNRDEDTPNGCIVSESGVKVVPVVEATVVAAQKLYDEGYRNYPAREGFWIYRTDENQNDDAQEISQATWSALLALEDRH